MPANSVGSINTAYSLKVSRATLGGENLTLITHLFISMFFGGSFLAAIYLGIVMVPSPKIVINLPMTYEKLSCKIELYRFSG